MRHRLAHVATWAVGLALPLALAACPTPKSPSGPPPEYEEPPAPSWLDGGSADSSAAGDGGLSLRTPD